MRWQPVVAGLVAVAVGGLLVLSGEEAPPEPEPDDAAPTTTFARESPHLRWLLLGESSTPRGLDGGGRPTGLSLASVHDLERDATVARLHTTDGPRKASLVNDVDGAVVGDTVRFSAWLWVSGSVQASLFLAAPETRTMQNRGLPTRNLVEVSTEGEPVEPGRWVRREVSLVVPERAGLLFYGIRFDGDGELAIDDVVGP